MFVMQVPVYTRPHLGRDLDRYGLDILPVLNLIWCRGPSHQVGRKLAKSQAGCNHLGEASDGP